LRPIGADQGDESGRAGTDLISFDPKFGILKQAFSEGAMNSEEIGKFAQRFGRSANHSNIVAVFMLQQRRRTHE
jgi:hypothetical protein